MRDTDTFKNFAHCIVQDDETTVFVLRKAHKSYGDLSRRSKYRKRDAIRSILDTLRISVAEAFSILAAEWIQQEPKLPHAVRTVVEDLQKLDYQFH